MLNDFETVTEAIEQLKAKGYKKDFNLLSEQECLVCNNNEHILTPEEFDIDYVFRFEGMSDPADETVLYAISSSKHNVKGILINAFGIYANETASKIIQKLNMHR